MHLVSTSATYRAANYPVCSFPGCTRTQHTLSSGLCCGHWRRQRAGQPLIPLRAPNGQAWEDDAGYLVTTRIGHPNARANGQIAVHRLVMAEHLGRPLEPDETVHHKDGDKQRNVPPNLELWVGTHHPGQRVEDLTAFALTHLRRYAPALLVESAVV